MTSHDPARQPHSPTLLETARRRGELHATLIAVEDTIARPASGREAEWAAAVDDALAALEQRIESHVEITEAPDGLYDELTEVAPRLTHKVDGLRSEHGRMLGQTRALRQRLQLAPPAGPDEVEAIRDDTVELLGLLVGHRRRGSDLVWEAYSVDIGGIG